MGIITSKDTRRISFNNTLAMTPTLVQKPVEDIENILAIDEISHTSTNLDDLEDYDYWTQRVKSLKKNHLEISQIIEDEYQKTVENTNKLFQPPKITEERIQKIKPCFDWRAKMLQCYEDNPRQTLMCSALVEGFSNCVSACQLED